MLCSLRAEPKISPTTGLESLQSGGLFIESKVCMKRVAIFGGSFDPPGLHHQQIAVAVSRHIESVWVVPFAVRSDKTSSVHAQRRLQMCHRTFLSIPQVHVFERFIDRPVLSMNFLEDLKDLWTQPVEY